MIIGILSYLTKYLPQIYHFLLFFLKLLEKSQQLLGIVQLKI